MEKPKVVTLCGSKKFADDFLKVKELLTRRGDVVLMPIFDIDLHLEEDPDMIEKLHKIHDQKILMSDFIIVISIGGYIGDDTDREIKFAKWNDKQVLYLDNINDLYSVNSIFRDMLNTIEKNYGGM